MKMRNTEANSRLGMWVPLLFVTMLLLAGCNTFRGAGEDVEAGGEAIQGAADRSGRAIDDATD